MNVGTRHQPIDATPPRFRSMWASGRLTLFFCFVLTGVALDGYCALFLHVSHCEALVVPVFFTGVLFVPAVASIIFARNAYYRVVCFVLLVIYCAVCAHESMLDGLDGICRRDRGDTDTELILIILTIIYFAPAIIAVNFAFGMFVLVRKSYEGLRRRSRQEM